MTSPFTPNSILAGFSRDEFSSLTKAQKYKLIALLSRVSEKSFRRGFQQGHFAHGKGRELVDLTAFRFDAPLDDSPDPDDPERKRPATSSIERLEQNFGELSQLGLRFHA